MQGVFIIHTHLLRLDGSITRETVLQLITSVMFAVLFATLIPKCSLYCSTINCLYPKVQYHVSCSPEVKHSFLSAVLYTILIIHPKLRHF